VYDRPDVSELIDAVRQHLEQQVIPAVKDDPKLYFQTLVAANVLKIAGRDLALSVEQLHTAWDRLNELRGEAVPFPPNEQLAHSEMGLRNRDLCAEIRAGEWDDPAQMKPLLAMAAANTVDALRVANPKFLAALEEEAKREP